MGDVIDMRDGEKAIGYTSRGIDPKEMLENCASGIEFDEVVLVGRKVDGELFVGSSSGSEASANWLLDRAKDELVRLAFDLGEEGSR